MKKTVLAFSLIAIGFASNAQVSNFEGFSAGLNLASISGSTKFGVGNNNTNPTIDGVGKQAWTGQVQAGYGIQMSTSSVFTIGAKYGLSASKIGTLTFDDGSLSAKAKNQLSLEFAPGTLLNDKTLAYGIISYERAKLVGDFTDNTVAPAVNSSRSANVKGSGYGAGIRTMLDNKTYFQVEVKQINYGATSLVTADGDLNFTTKAAVGTIGIGKKF